MCAQYANFDPAIDPSPVIGWYDTDAVGYNSLPPFNALLLLTPEQWLGRLPAPTNWAVSGGNTLIPYTAPLPPPQEAQILLAQHLALGIALTSVSLPNVNATYALDEASTAQIFQIGTFANSFGTFPSGSGTQPYPDINAVPHLFNISVFIAFLRAVAALVSDLQTQAGIYANGGNPIWPNQTVEII